MDFWNNIILLSIFLCFVTCQENAGTNVSPSLKMCYNNTRLATRDYRLPATMNVFIDIIRKIEEGNPTQDTRELAYELLHRFRQDGIRKTNKEIDSSKGLPYSPKGWEAYKNRVQLYQITPGNAINFNNDSISDLEACSIHYMISNTIEPQLRDDADSVCSTLARYTLRIHKRQVNEWVESDPSQKSKCPIESGVVYTKWGAIKAGLIIAGIASGYESNPIKIDNTTLESAYASTIASDVAETALNQVSTTKTVGNKGHWNSSVEPKYYFLENADKENLYLTDAEIRGGLDGLFLALNIPNWKSKASNLKISQILDMYYSRGVFNNTARACNRKSITQDLVNDDKLIQQSIAYSKLLDKQSQLSYTPNEEKVPEQISSVVSSLRTYIGSSLNDLECSAETDLYERVSTDVLIFVDTAWGHDVIHPLLSYILENIDVNKYSSSYTIFDGANCDIIVNKTTSISDFYEFFNRTTQLNYPTGFDYIKVVQKGQVVFQNKLNNETDLTGQSTIILMLPHNTPTSSQNSYIEEKIPEFKRVLPDLRIIVGGSGSKSSYNALVSNTAKDIITISDNPSDSDIKTSGEEIVERFQQIPRAVVNPKCGSSFSNEETQSTELVQYVEPYGINYHRISPNYFNEGQTLKIRGQGYGSLKVCTSRTDANPKDNSTSVKCQNISSDEMSIDISSYCIDETVTECNPIFISVQGIDTNVRCTDVLCRFPDNLKYTIVLENVHCSSSVKLLISSFLLSVLFLITRL